MEKKTDNLDFIKIKNFHLSKDTIKKVKKQATGQEKKCHLPYIYLTKDLYPNTKNSYKSIRKRDNLKIGQEM